MSIDTLVPQWAVAGGWGLFSGSALILGALFGYFLPAHQRVIAGIMAFGSGVLISALTLELMEEAFKQGGFTFTALGFLFGALLFTGANWWLAHRGARYRKHSGKKHSSEGQDEGSGLAIALGSLLDGIPESIVIGISMLKGGSVSLVAVAAIFLSNIPEGLSSAAGMKKAGRSASYVVWLWLGIAIACGLASLLGFVAFRHTSPEVIAAITAIAAGAILAMVADTMIPEAYGEAHDFTGLIAGLGFLSAFMLSHLNH